MPFHTLVFSLLRNSQGKGLIHGVLMRCCLRRQTDIGGRLWAVIRYRDTDEKPDRMRPNFSYVFLN